MSDTKGAYCSGCNDGGIVCLQLVGCRMSFVNERGGVVVWSEGGGRRVVPC